VLLGIRRSGSLPLGGQEGADALGRDIIDLGWHIVAARNAVSDLTDAR
jgi:hypothetical protein